MRRKKTVKSKQSKSEGSCEEVVELNALEKMEGFFSAISWRGVLTLKYEKQSDKCSGLLAISYSLGLSKHGKSSWETLAGYIT